MGCQLVRWLKVVCLYVTVHLQLQPTRVAQARARGCEMYWGPVWIPTPGANGANAETSTRKASPSRAAANTPLSLPVHKVRLGLLYLWQNNNQGQWSWDIFSQAIIILTVIVKCLVDISRVHEVCKSTNMTSGASSCIKQQSTCGSDFWDTHETWVPQIIWSYPCI